MKPYKVTQHAVNRAVERLGLPAEHAKSHLVQIMQSAYYQGDQENHAGNTTKVFDHHKTRTRLIVDNDKIVTVYKMPETSTLIPSVFADEIKRLIKRQLTKAKREFTRNYRSLEINAAELNIEIAQLRLNHAKARSPKVKLSINAKLDELMTKYKRIESEIDKVTAQYEEIKNGAEAYL